MAFRMGNISATAVNGHISVRAYYEFTYDELVQLEQGALSVASVDEVDQAVVGLYQQGMRQYEKWVERVKPGSGGYNIEKGSIILDRWWVERPGDDESALSHPLCGDFTYQGDISGGSSLVKAIKAFVLVPPWTVKYIIHEGRVGIKFSPVGDADSYSIYSVAGDDYDVLATSPDADVWVDIGEAAGLMDTIIVVSAMKGTQPGVPSQAVYISELTP